MSEIPHELKYTKNHEWIREQDDGTVLIGITDHAQTSLGDLVYVELPEAEDPVVSGEACAVVESVKAGLINHPLSHLRIEAQRTQARTAWLR